METHEFCCWFVSSIYWIHLRFMDKYHEWIIKKNWIHSTCIYCGQQIHEPFIFHEYNIL